MAKEIEFYALINQGMYEKETYTIANVSKALVDASQAAGGTQEMKDFIHKRIEELFNDSIADHFDGCEVTEKDVDDCINRLSVGEAACIANEDFWWDKETTALTIEL